MGPALASVVFLASGLLTFVAAAFFAEKLDQIGPRLGLPEVVVGLLTALAADAPEISSAVIALSRGEKQVGLGVVLGSNVFNLAAMIGLTAVLAGTITVPRVALVIEGVVALLATLVAAGLVVGLLSPWLALVLFAAIIAPYLLGVTRRAGAGAEGGARVRRHVAGSATWKPAALLLPAVALIVLGSFGMVRSAVLLAGDWHVPRVIVGILVLAVLTSLPNAFTAVRLGLSHRGVALVSETLGSNTINLVGGLLVPALFIGLEGRSGTVDFDLAWLLGMTCLALLLLGRRRGLSPRAGIALIALYAIFVAVQVILA